MSQTPQCLPDDVRLGRHYPLTLKQWFAVSWFVVTQQIVELNLYMRVNMYTYVQELDGTCIFPVYTWLLNQSSNQPAAEWESYTVGIGT
jgi:hypothetical protein